MSAFAVITLMVASCSSDDDPDEDTSSGASSTTEQAEQGGDDAPAEASGDPFEFVILADVTGALTPTFGPAEAGLQTYIDMINDQGGVHGRPIEVELIDTQSSPDVALTAAQQALNQDGLLALLQMGTSSGAARILPMTTEAGIAFVTTSLTDEAMLPTPVENAFQIGVVPTQLAVAGSGYMEELLGDLDGKKVAVVALNSPYMDGVLAATEPRLEEVGAEIGRIERHDYGVPSFQAQASNIVGDDPDLVYLLDNAADTITIVTALEQAGLDVPIIATDGSAAQDVVETLASDLFNAPTAVQYPTENVDFIELAEAGGRGEAVASTHYSAVGWVMGAAIVEALEQCGDACVTADFVEAMESIDGFDPPLGISYGSVTFSADDHIAFDVMRYHSYADGELTESDDVDINP